MAVNKYFNNFGYKPEQNLVEDLIVESIKQYGHEVKYIPRTLVEEDHIFGEDTLSKFQSAIPVEVYIQNVEGFEDVGEFVSRFGMEVHHQITFLIAKKRWEQIRLGESLQTEVGYSLQNESANTAAPGPGMQYQIETGTVGANNYGIIPYGFPNEGDLIWFEMTGKMFEIKNMEHETRGFYPNGALNMFELKCEVFEYTSQVIDTGDTEIDNLETLFSQNTLDYQFSLDVGDEGYGAGQILWEDGGFSLQEFTATTNNQVSANNSLFQIESAGIIDFSETNPFSEVDRY